LRSAAEREGWEVSDLARVLICLTADLAFLFRGNSDGLARLKARVGLSEAASVLSSLISEKRSSRPYAYRGFLKSSVLRIRIPEHFDDAIRQYAFDRSVNETYARFLRDGLILHLKARTAFLRGVKAIQAQESAVEWISGMDQSSRQ